MAEGHQAVAFSFAVTHEGLDVNFDFEVIRLIARAAVRSWRKKTTRFQVCYTLNFYLQKPKLLITPLHIVLSQSNIKSSFFPGSLRSLILTEAVVVAAEKNGQDLTLGLTNKLVPYFPRFFFNLSRHLLASFNQ